MNELHEAIYLITKYLRTKYESKNHGGYNIYEDDKIYVSEDTYYPNRHIDIKQGKNLICVHSSSGKHTSKNNPGKWVDYVLLDLLPKAKLEEEKKKKELEQERIRLKKINFGKVDNKLDSIFD